MPCIGHLIADDENRFEKDTNSDVDSIINFDIQGTSPTNFEYCYDVSDLPLIQKIKNKIASKERFFSLEFFPPRTKQGAANLISRMERMNKGKPLFMDVTWHAGMASASKSICSSMTIASSAVNYCGIDILLHVTSAGLTKDNLREILNLAKSHGIRSIMALSGDNHCNSDFQYSCEFVRWIREEYGDEFSIAVAGYPQGHPDSDYESSLQHLKAKVDAGADFVVTQLMFDIERYEQFLGDCKQLGINIPIIPGILPIQNYDSLRKLSKLASNVPVPKELVQEIEGMKGDDEAIREIGVKFSTTLIEQLFERDLAYGTHIYTLNREVGPKAILKELGLWCKDVSRRHFPWQGTGNKERSASEDVRPVYWAMRPKSYMTRTRDWDEFPNGRWGNSSNPAFGELDDYHLFYMSKPRNTELLRMMWGQEVRKIEDIQEIFTCFLSGALNREGVQVTELPWCYEDLHSETYAIKDKLLEMNKHFLFTINSQPNINAAKSNDQTYGWGPKNGYIYQKAYLEFFCRREDARLILEKIQEFPLLSYTLANKGGEDCYTNYRKNTPVALTWGVFPGRELLQPTIADYKTFLIWKDEAFALWDEKWGSIYGEEDVSRARLAELAEDMYLVCLVDNDYISSEGLWSFLDAVYQAQAENENGVQKNGHHSERVRNDTLTEA